MVVTVTGIRVASNYWDKHQRKMAIRGTGCFPEFILLLQSCTIIT